MVDGKTYTGTGNILHAFKLHFSNLTNPQKDEETIPANQNERDVELANILSKVVTTIFHEKCFLYVSFRQQLMHVLQKSEV